MHHRLLFHAKFPADRRREWINEPKIFLVIFAISALQKVTHAWCADQHEIWPKRSRPQVYYCMRNFSMIGVAMLLIVQRFGDACNIYSAPEGEQDVVIITSVCQSFVCLSVRSHNSKTTRTNFTNFWPTVLSVEPLVQYLVCLSSVVCRLSVVCL